MKHLYFFLGSNWQVNRPTECLGKGYTWLEKQIRSKIVNKNVSSSTSHKKLRLYVLTSLRPYVFTSLRLYVLTSLRPYVFTSLRLSVFTSFRLSLRDFKKLLPNTFIYELILIKIYMKTIIMNTQIFNFDKYDLKGHWRSQKVICLSWNLKKFFITHSFMNWSTFFAWWYILH